MRLHLAPLGLLLSGCGTGQYLAIQGAWVDSEDLLETTTNGTAQVPVVTVTQGSSNLVLGESVTVNVDFSSITEIEVADITIVVVPVLATWVYELSDEEVAAGNVDLEISALESEPTDPSCEVNTRFGQNGWCAEPAESGVTEAVLWAQNKETNSMGVEFPLTLAALGDTGSDACESFTYDDCCSSSETLLCAIDPICQCPEGTEPGEVGGDGLPRCMCQL
jgi:hypothetical protein